MNRGRKPAVAAAASSSVTLRDRAQRAGRKLAVFVMPKLPGNKTQELRQTLKSRKKKIKFYNYRLEKIEILKLKPWHVDYKTCLKIPKSALLFIYQKNL